MKWFSKLLGVNKLLLALILVFLGGLVFGIKYLYTKYSPKNEQSGVAQTQSGEEGAKQPVSTSSASSPSTGSTATTSKSNSASQSPKGPQPAAQPVNITDSVIDPPDQFGGECGTNTFNWSATLTSDKAGAITYRWVDSQGGQGPVQSLSFAKAEAKPIASYSFSVATPSSGDSKDGEVHIHIISPAASDSVSATWYAGCPTEDDGNDSL